MTFGKNKNTTDGGLGPNYNVQHFVFMTKYRNPVFNNGKIIEIAREAFYHAAGAHDFQIKKLSFGDDFAHIHMEANVPNTITISKAVQIMKSYSAYILFYKIPAFRKLYPRGHFWSGYYSNGSVGPQNEETVQNYITRQDISGRFVQ